MYFYTKKSFYDKATALQTDRQTDGRTDASENITTHAVFAGGEQGRSQEFVLGGYKF